MAKRIIRTIADKNGALVKFLPEGTDTWLTREEAIQKALRGEISAVVVRPKTGSPYLRDKGDTAKTNNFAKIAIRPRRGIYSEWHFASGTAPLHTRPNPNAGWKSKTAGKLETAAAFVAWVYTAIGSKTPHAAVLNKPYMKAMLTHWQGNSGKEFSIDMKHYLSVSSAERGTANEALKGAAEFAEANLKVGNGRTIMTSSKPRPAGNLSNESTDLWYAVGGHTGFAKALIQKVNLTTFELEFEYTLEDFFTFGGKGFFPGFHEWHLKGLAHDFLTSGSWEKKFRWTIGKFDGKA